MVVSGGGGGDYLSYGVIRPTTELSEFAPSADGILVGCGIKAVPGAWIEDETVSCPMQRVS